MLPGRDDERSEPRAAPERVDDGEHLDRLGRVPTTTSTFERGILSVAFIRGQHKRAMPAGDCEDTGSRSGTTLCDADERAGTAGRNGTRKRRGRHQAPA